MGFWDFFKRAKVTLTEEGFLKGSDYTEEEAMDYVAAKLRGDPHEMEMRMMPGCNRYTNSPCEWSKTPAIEDKCIKCNVQFPGWS